MAKKYTPSVVNAYIKYLERFSEIVVAYDRITLFEYQYDFEAEHKIIAKCKAGEVLTITDLPPRESEC